jgi:hypothetical protein
MKASKRTQEAQILRTNVYCISSVMGNSSEDDIENGSKNQQSTTNNNKDDGNDAFVSYETIEDLLGTSPLVALLYKRTTMMLIMLMINLCHSPKCWTK